MAGRVDPEADPTAPRCVEIKGYRCRFAIRLNLDFLNSFTVDH
jgi:hypothetical protein